MAENGEMVGLCFPKPNAFFFCPQRKYILFTFQEE